MKVFLLAPLLLVSSVKAEVCERLKATLAFTQEKAPRDLSGVLPVVVERVNREMEGVVDVEVEWTGSDLHGRVGEHMIDAKVTRLVSALTVAPEKERVQTDSEGRKVIVQCLQLPFTVQDTNECLLSEGHPMRHKCQEPAMCVNTIGSYECVCPKLGETAHPESTVDEDFWKTLAQASRSSWEVSYNLSSQSSCPGAPSTHACCPSVAHNPDGKSCRAAFQCPVDPCGSTKNDCSSNARCVRADAPPEYSCVCPKGLMGNGKRCTKGDPTPRPMVKFDGVTPTQETIRNNYYCGCTKPEVDACEGFPPCKGNHEICVVTSGNTPMCACKPGYVNNHDGYGCVDESPPVLKLRHDPNDDQTMRLRQGDFYKEYAVDIIDENAEEYLRSLRITYSKPLPPGCIVQMGDFHVNYTVATPWTSYQFVRVTRHVIVEDIDECTLDTAKYQNTCPELIPQCDVAAGAQCINTIGSYTCKCPKHTTGDGFKASSSFASTLTPAGYKGGTSCVDTSKPVIEIMGPNPKVLRVCKCGGLTGVMGSGNNQGAEHDRLCAQQRSKYGRNLKELIDSTSGAELCATHRAPNPKPSDCVKATDHTYRGVDDISSRVEIGEPVEKSPMHWSVPYNVVDAAGNKAATVWRDVVVEEVDIFDLENNVRQEVLASKDKEIKEAIRKAVAEERAKHEQVESKTKTSSRRDEPKSCPACPKCICQYEEFHTSKCDSYCETEFTGSCPSSREFQWLFFAQYLWGAVTSNMTATVAATTIAVFAVRFLFTLLFNPDAFFGYAQYNFERASSNIRAETVAGERPRPPYTDPPNASRRAPEGGIFSPQSSREYYHGNNNFRSPPLAPANGGTSPFDDSIYAGEIITPNKRGDYDRRH